MRKRWCVLLGVMVGLLIAPTAQAQTDVKEVVGALKETRVYVASDAEGTTQDTEGELAAQLNDNDNMVLVMLPENGDDPETVAQAINKATGHKYIVGISIGGQLAATSTIMPDEVARDLMRRAVDTGTNPAERLGTFARNVHEWQSDHPNEPASKKTDEGGGSLVLFIVLAVVLGAAAIGVVLFRRQRDTEEEIRFEASPAEVRNLLRDIQHLMPQIRDERMCETIRASIKDTEEYFNRAVDETALNRETGVFVEHLTSVKDILSHYVDIQNFGRYYHDPEELMKEGREAVESFSVFVL